MPMHLVAGGSGYFGCILVRVLRQKGLKVRVFDLNDASDRSPDVEFIQGDIRSPAEIGKACQGADVIYNAIAQVPLVKNKELLCSVNIDGARNLFDSALKHSAKKVVHISSSAVFGIPPKNPVDDTVVPNPLEDYGRAKYKAEQIAVDYIKRGLDITIIRPRTILGDERLGIFSVLFDWVRSGTNVPVLGSGDNRYQFVHPLDLANACLLAAERKGPSVYNIGAEEFGTMRQLLEDLIRHAGSPSKVKSLPFGPAVFLMKLSGLAGLSPLAPYHWLMYGRELFFDLTKPKKELGWQPKYSSRQMAAESYDWFCSHYDEIRRQAQGSAHRRPVKQGMLQLIKWFL